MDNSKRRERIYCDYRVVYYNIVLLYTNISIVIQERLINKKR